MLAIVSILLVIFVGLRWQGGDDTAEPLPDSSEPDPLVRQVERLSLPELVGQLLVVGLDGSEVGPSARRLISDYHVGGFVLYSSNIKSVPQLVRLLDQLKAINSAVGTSPLFLSVDEEGGSRAGLRSWTGYCPGNLRGRLQC